MFDEFSNIKIKYIELSDVLLYDKIKYNTQNHHENGKPDDYLKKSLECDTKHWIDKFKKTYTVIHLDKNDLNWMKQAAIIGMQTKCFSNLYKEELNIFLEKNKFISNLISSSKEKYFVRCDNVSLKYGCHGTGPYSDLKNIIESLVTCPSTHRPYFENITELKLYLIPWQQIDPDKEFRVFVHNNKITAISQQHLYQINKTLKMMSDEEKSKTILNWIHVISTYFEKIIIKQITHIDSYVMDIAILENNSAYFIEINPFGKEYSSGSSLFHWIVDEEILYDKNNDGLIYFRSVVQ